MGRWKKGREPGSGYVPTRHRAARSMYFGTRYKEMRDLVSYRCVVASTLICKEMKRVRGRVRRSRFDEVSFLRRYARIINVPFDVLWYSYINCGTRLLALVNEQTPLYREISRLSKIVDAYGDPLSIETIHARLAMIGIEVEYESIPVIRSYLRNYGHDIRTTHKVKAQPDPMTGIVIRMRERLSKRTMSLTGTALLWSRVILNDGRVVPEAAKEMSREFLTRFHRNDLVTGQEFMAAITDIAGTKLALRIAA